MPGTLDTAQIQLDISKEAWTSAGRSIIGFVRTSKGIPASLGSGTLIKFGNVTGILTCAHVLEALGNEAEIGILCFPVRATQIQTFRVPMGTTEGISIGSAPWSAKGPDLAFLRLPPVTVSEIERIATVVNGDRQRANIVAGDPERIRTFCAVAGVVDELTRPAIVVESGDTITSTTPFEALINAGHVFVEDDDADLFRLQPVPGEGTTLPQSYKGTSGGGLWKFLLDQDDLSVIQVQLIGVAFWEKLVDSEMHIIGHAGRSIYEALYKAIQEKWPNPV